MLRSMVLQKILNRVLTDKLEMITDRLSVFIYAESASTGFNRIVERHGTLGAGPNIMEIGRTVPAKHGLKWITTRCSVMTPNIGVKEDGYAFDGKHI